MQGNWAQELLQWGVEEYWRQARLGQVRPDVGAEQALLALELAGHRLGLSVAAFPRERCRVGGP